MTPPSTHTRASKLRNTVVRFPQPVCSLVTRHQRLAAAATSTSGRQSVVEWPINHNPNVLNRSQLDGTESFLVFPSAIFRAVWKAGYVSVFFLPLFRLFSCLRKHFEERVVAPFHTLWILCRQVGPEYTCMDIYISRCSFLHDSTLVSVTTEQSRELRGSENQSIKF